MDATRESPVHEKGHRSSGSSSKPNTNNGAMGAVYGLGFIGAGIYWIQAADSLWEGVLGFLKALVWPAFLVYEALQAINA